MYLTNFFFFFSFIKSLYFCRDIDKIFNLQMYIKMEFKHLMANLANAFRFLGLVCVAFSILFFMYLIVCLIALCTGLPVPTI